MDAFSDLSVLLSIILGLGFTQLFAAAGRLIGHRDRVRVHWLPLLWAAVMVLLYVQVWWSMYGLRLHRDWTFLAFGAVLAQAAALYLMAAVVLPELVDEAGVDLAAVFNTSKLRMRSHQKPPSRDANQLKVSHEMWRHER